MAHELPRRCERGEGNDQILDKNICIGKQTSNNLVPPLPPICGFPFPTTLPRASPHLRCGANLSAEGVRPQRARVAPVACPLDGAAPRVPQGQEPHPRRKLVCSQHRVANGRPHREMNVIARIGTRIKVSVSNGVVVQNRATRRGQSAKRRNPIARIRTRIKNSDSQDFATTALRSQNTPQQNKREGGRLA